MWSKRTLLLALILMHLAFVATSVGESANVNLKQPKTCQAKNHMLQYLRNNGVMIHERPVKIFNYCQKEWSVFGSCCEISSLRTVIKKKIYLNNFALDEVQKEIGAIHSKLVEFRNSYKSQNHTANLSVAAVGNGISFSTALAGHTVSLPSYQKTAIEQSLDAIESSISNKTISRQQSQKVCVNAINNVISKTACSLCSSRSDSFFNHENKLSISEHNCRALLSNCSDAWYGMVELVKEVGNYTSKVRQLVGFNDADGSMEEKAFTMNLDSFIKNSNLLRVLKNCHKGELASCSFKEVSTLCEQFIHIQSPTYIESSQSQLSKLVGELKSVELNYNTSYQNFTMLRERLQLLDQSFPEGSDHSGKYHKDKKHMVVRLSQVFRDGRIGWMSIKEIASMFRGFSKSSRDKTLKHIISKNRGLLRDLNAKTNKLMLAVLKLQHAHLRRLLMTNSVIMKGPFLEPLYRAWSVSTTYLEELLFPVSISAPRHPRIAEAIALAYDREQAFLTRTDVSRDSKMMHKFLHHNLKRLMTYMVGNKSGKKQAGKMPIGRIRQSKGRKLEYMLLGSTDTSNGEFGSTETCIANDNFCLVSDNCSDISNEVIGLCDDSSCSQQHDEEYRESHDAAH